MKMLSLRNFLFCKNFVLKNSLLIYFSSFILGGLTLFAYSPFGYWPIIPLSLFFMLLFFSELKLKQAIFSWFSYFLGKMYVGCSWLTVSLILFSPLNVIESYLAIFALCLVASFLFLLFAPCLFKCNPANSKSIRLLLFPALWCLFEWIRSFLFSGYPWLWEGYALSNSFFFSLAPFIGSLGLTFLAVTLAVFPVSVITKQFKPAVFFCCIIVSAVSASIYLNVKNVNKNYDYLINVSVVQANISQETKWKKDYRAYIFEKYKYLIKQAATNSDIIILPETALPVTIDYDNLPKFFINTNEFLRSKNKSLIAGFLHRNGNLKYNSAGVFGLDYKGAFNSYNKNHLLPFGEYFPLYNFFSNYFDLSKIGLSNFASGNNYSNSLSIQGYSVYPVICYEIAFPSEILQRFINSNDFILHLSNDTWFAHSSGPSQHLQISQMRAAEFGRSLVRSNNNGYTALIDHTGKIIEQSLNNKDYVLDFAVPVVHKQTFFVKYGHKPILAFCSLLIALAVSFPFICNLASKLKNK